MGFFLCSPQQRNIFEIRKSLLKSLCMYMCASESQILSPLGDYWRQLSWSWSESEQFSCRCCPRQQAGDSPVSPSARPARHVTCVAASETEGGPRWVPLGSSVSLSPCPTTRWSSSVSCDRTAPPTEHGAAPVAFSLPRSSCSCVCAWDDCYVVSSQSLVSGFSHQHHLRQALALIHLARVRIRIRVQCPGCIRVVLVVVGAGTKNTDWRCCWSVVVNMSCCSCWCLCCCCLCCWY